MIGAAGAGTGTGGKGAGVAAAGAGAGGGGVAVLGAFPTDVTTTCETPAWTAVPHGGPNPPDVTVTGISYVRSPTVRLMVVLPALYAQNRPEVDD